MKNNKTWSKGLAINIRKPIIGKVAFQDFSNPNKIRENEILLCRDANTLESCDDYIAFILLENPSQPDFSRFSKNLLILRDDHFFSNLIAEDIVIIYPNGVINILYNSDSFNNFLFIHENCNNNCLMCSQPPLIKEDTDELFNLNMYLIDLLPKDIKVLGISGGEPTLLGINLYHLIEKISNILPETEVQVLTNARAFGWINYVKIISSLKSHNIIFSIPLFSDYPALHNFIAQADNAFEQTILGIYNLARYDQRIEIRIILQKHTIPRLYKLAEFIYRYMPFVEHVVFMGLEYTGFAKTNHGHVWIEPDEYIKALEESVDFLKINQMQVSIYNLPLCLLPKNLWIYSRDSITEWKKTFDPKCANCLVCNICSGIFSSSFQKMQHLIKPIKN